MYAEMIRILSQENQILQALLGTEKSKRRHILSASGKQLHELTKKSELLLEELNSLESIRLQILSGNSGTSFDITLGTILKNAKTERNPAYDRLNKIAGDMRESARLLRVETEENNRLLDTTARSVSRFIQNIKDLSKTDAKSTYRPDGERASGKNTTRAVLIDANA